MMNAGHNFNEEREIAEALGEQPRQGRTDALERIATALEAQNAIIGRLADAFEDIAAIAVAFEPLLKQLTDQVQIAGTVGVWGEDDADADPLAIPL